MTRYTDLELPADETAATRIEWAGERYADLSEGSISDDVGWFIWQYIVGWTDIGATKDERRSYLAMARNFADLLNSRKEDV